MNSILNFVSKCKKTVAVIIPAYNEQAHIGGCIESLLNQTVPVDEIIVICNNCSDKTYSIAKSYKGVKVKNIKQKSLINARNIGFSMTNCDILARLNADVICEKNWNEELLKSFQKKDTSAVAGVARTKTIPLLPWIRTRFWSRVYLLSADAFFGTPTLWGANMTILNSAWHKISSNSCLVDSEVHEDQDIAIHIASTGGSIIKNTNLIVDTDEKSYYSWSKFKRYVKVMIHTKTLHKELLNSPKVKRISFIKRVAYFAISVFPSILFFIGSFITMIICWPINYLFDRRRF